MDPKQYKPFKLREQNVAVLSKNLGELQVELAKIKVVRKAIARTLTTLNQKKRQELKDMYKDKKALKAFNTENKTTLRFSDKPFDLRAKTTRAKRRAMTKRQLNAKTLRQRKREANFPQRVYAVRA